MSSLNTASLGFGVGLRAEHYPEILSGARRCDWFEAITENYLDTGGWPLHVLERLRRDYPIALHGVALSIGSADELNRPYLLRLRRLIERIEPALVTDHLCWSSIDGRHLYDLLPLPYTEATLAYVSERIERVQESLGRQIALENPSSYIGFAQSRLREWEMLAELARRADCGILLDINNVYVSARNLGFDPLEYIDGLPANRVVQIHLAGFTDMGGYLFDTHSAPVHAEVWQLYRYAVRRFGAVSTLVEWDADLPSFERVCEEVGIARQIVREESDSLLCDDRDGLRTVQQQVAQCIVDGGGPGEWLKLPDGCDAHARIHVYAAGYLARLRSALQEAYPALAHLCGRRRFAELVDRFVAVSPPVTYDLNQCGAGLRDYLGGDPLTAELPFLADLARLEWAIVRAFHADVPASAEGKAAARGSLADWVSSTIDLRSDVAVVSSPWPIVTLWQARETAIEQIDLDLHTGGQSALIYRDGHEVCCEVIPAAEATALTVLSQQRSLEAVIGEVLRGGGDVATAGAWLGRWLRAGMIAVAAAAELRV
ncbi:MAG TPA: DUF692 family protein [Terriglobales bacterium]|nr:DUF692 family protein [Terriglobales bacterium]